MTCTCCLFDPITKEMTLANAGHLFPYVVGENGIRNIRMKGRPIGFPSQKGVSLTCETLQPGEWVLFYTDGIIEATHHDGKQIGFDRVENNLLNARKNNPEETEAAVRMWFHSQLKNSAAEDDITLLVLQETSPIRGLQT